MNLNCTNISGLSSAEHLAKVIRSNTCLEELHLGNNNFQSLADVILRALQINNNLKGLDLNSNGISGDVGELLVIVITSKANLKDLCLGFNKLQSSGVVIAQALQVLSTVKILHLSGNSMSENVAKELTAVIKCNNGLEDLRLSSNNFQLSISLILQSLTDSMHLKILQLSNKTITGEAAETLVSAIETNIQLEEVSLPNNGFQGCAVVIIHALKSLSKLKKLNLNDNKMSSSISYGLAEVITNNNSLSELLVSNNNLQSSAIVICNALMRISTLKKLNFNNNGLSENLVQGLADVIN